MSIYSLGAEAFSAARALATGSRARRCLTELEANQRLPTETFARMQWQRMMRLLAYADAHVPFYRRQFASLGLAPAAVGSLNDWRRIPILTRADVRRHLSDLRADVVGRGVRSTWTSGSTGTPMEFYQDQAVADYSQAAMLRLRRWHGLRRGDKTAYVWGMRRDLRDGRGLDRIVTRLRGQKWLNAFRMSPEDIAAFVDVLRRWQPRLILGYASPLHEIAQFMLEHGIRRVRPVAVESWAERLYEHQRRDIEQAFGCQVANVYASREFHPIAAECPAHTGLHVMADLRLVELVDEQGEPVGPGVTGRVIITDLVNYTMPFIRYDTGDLAVATDQACSCSCRFPLLASIEGRVMDVFRTRDGTLMGGAPLITFFWGLPGIDRFQAHQVSLDEVVIRVTTRPGFVPGVLDDARRKLDVFTRGAFQIRFEIVDEIPVTESGKYRFTISDVARPGHASAP